MEAAEHVRLDKFLWAVRLYKTRSLAAQACQGGQIKLNGRSVKPAYAVKAGDTVTSNRGGWTKSLKVISLLERRVGAARVPEFIEDLTPAEEYQKARDARASRETSAQHQANLKNKKQARPTKRDRRQMEDWFKMHRFDQA